MSDRPEGKVFTSEEIKGQIRRISIAKHLTIISSIIIISISVALVMLKVINDVRGYF